MRCLYRNINATSNERPGTLLGDPGTSNPGERRVIGHFKYAVFPTDRLAEVQAFKRRWWTFPEEPVIEKPYEYDRAAGCRSPRI